MTHGHPLRISRPVRREARHARGLGRTEAAGRRTPGAPMRPSPGALGVSAHRAAGLADWHNPNSSIVSDRVHSHSLDRPPAGGQSAPAPVSLLSRRARVPARPPTACLRQWLPRRRPPRGSRSGRLGGSHLRRLAGPKAAAKEARSGGGMEGPARPRRSLPRLLFRQDVSGKWGPKPEGNGVLRFSSWRVLSGHLWAQWGRGPAGALGIA